MVGYNYRMTNIAAAIGLAQMERADELMAKKFAVAQQYDAALADLVKAGLVEVHRSNNPNAEHAYWMYSVLVDSSRRDEIMRMMLELGVETRPVFYPVHTMPVYRAQAGSDYYPVACVIAAGGINLPSWPDLSAEEILHVAKALENALVEVTPPIF